MVRDNRPKHDTLTHLLHTLDLGGTPSARSSQVGWLGHHATPAPGERHRLPKVLQNRCDIASAVASLANDLTKALPGRGDPAAVLDALRRRLLATDAAVWTCEGGSARRVLQANGEATTLPDAIADLNDAVVRIQRLRHAGPVLRRAGEVTGLEALVPAGIRSFAAAATTGGGSVTHVLVVGWPGPVPPCAPADVAPLQVAAMLIAGTLSISTPAVAPGTSSDAVLASLPERIAVVDREGIILTVNAAWSESADSQDGGSHVGLGPGVSYLEALRRSAFNGTREDATLLDGIVAVITGAVDRFQTTYQSAAIGEERWTMTTVTSLRHEQRGAVIVHADVTHQSVSDIAERIGQTQFQRLADRVPVPVLFVGPDGRVLQANQHWSDATGDRGGRRAVGATWTDMMDPETRTEATAALDAAVRHVAPFHIDLRLKGVDDRYRWWRCSFSPGYAPDGRVEGFIGACHDITAMLGVQTTLGEVKNKLAAAQEVERARIARELHDDLAQQIALLSVELEMLTTAPDRERAIADARSCLRQITDTVSQLTHRLHPGKVKLLGLVTALECLCRDMAREHSVHIDVKAQRIPRHFADEQAVTLFRVAQESLRNAIRHGGATHITVQLAGTPSRIMLQVTDNGCGFDPLTSGATGLGLLTMRERVELMSGTLKIEPVHPRGTTVRAVVPVRPLLAAIPTHQLRAGAVTRPAAVSALPIPRASAARGPRSNAS